MNQSGRMERTREALQRVMCVDDYGYVYEGTDDAALAEVEEWETRANDSGLRRERDDAIARAETAEAELAIEREANPNRVVCPKCSANLPCESCKRYAVALPAAEAEADRLKAALLAYCDSCNEHGGFPSTVTLRDMVAPADRNTT